MFDKIINYLSEIDHTEKIPTGVLQLGSNTTDDPLFFFNLIASVEDGSNSICICLAPHECTTLKKMIRATCEKVCEARIDDYDMKYLPYDINNLVDWYSSLPEGK